MAVCSILPNRAWEGAIPSVFYAVQAPSRIRRFSLDKLQVIVSVVMSILKTPNTMITKRRNKGTLTMLG